jgi:hypothetical protein
LGKLQGGRPRAEGYLSVEVFFPLTGQVHQQITTAKVDGESHGRGVLSGQVHADVAAARINFHLFE